MGDVRAYDPYRCRKRARGGGGWSGRRARALFTRGSVGVRRPGATLAAIVGPALGAVPGTARGAGLSWKASSERSGPRFLSTPLKRVRVR